MSDPVLSQLVSVENDLSQQVITLEAKLTQLSAQRQGLRTVMDMFQDTEGGGTKVSQAVAARPASTKKKAPAKKSAAKTTSKTKAAKTSSPAKKSAKKTTRKTAAKSGRKAKTSKISTRKKKKDGRAATWQKYVQSPYRDTALPEAVSSVLRGQPSEVFTIADVMSSIFTEAIPRTSFLKARNRISNILSAGARDGTWYRGRNGRYSQSESVTKLK
ncbi:MAG: hypothetical protein AAGC93_19745 [Cyanobacteria bacterium P01_F01_bin.53]